MGGCVWVCVCVYVCGGMWRGEVSECIEVECKEGREAEEETRSVH